MSKKHVFEGKKHVFLTKNGLINSGVMSIKQLNKERQPLVNFFSDPYIGVHLKGKYYKEVW